MDLSQDIKYITAKEASALTGYVADYITRQCRAGKIASRQIGRVWLIDKGSLLSHFASEATRKEENAKALARERGAEYAAAKKAREGRESVQEIPIESPFAPVPVHPSWFSDEVSSRTVRGSFAALALTLSVLSAGLYAGLPETQRAVMVSTYQAGAVVLDVTEEAVVALRRMSDRSSAPALVAKERVVVSVAQHHPAQLEIPVTHELVAALSIPEISAPKLVPYTPSSQNLFTPAREAFRVVSIVAQSIPRTIVSGIHGLGLYIASAGNEAPHKTVAFVRSLEGEALGVVGHIALAYDTAKNAVSGAYNYAPRANLAAVSGTSVVVMPHEAGERSFVEHVFENIVAGMGDIANGIGDFVAGRIRATELCVTDEEGETCLTRAELQELLEGVGVTEISEDNKNGGGHTLVTEELPSERLPEEPSAEWLDEDKAIPEEQTTGGGSSVWNLGNDLEVSEGGGK